MDGRKAYDGNEYFTVVQEQEMTVGEALDVNLALEQVHDHVGPCSDDNLRSKSGSSYDDRLLTIDNRVICPRCFLLLAQDSDARWRGMMLDAKLRLRVIVRIDYRDLLDRIVWD